MRNLARQFMGALCVFVVSGCAASAGEATDTDESEIGKLSVTWTFVERNDSKLCASSDVAAIAFQVNDANGNHVFDTTEKCTSMAKTIALPAGSYMATATALDADGSPRSTPIYTNPFTLTGTDRVLANIDFTAGALY